MTRQRGTDSSNRHRTISKTVELPSNLSKGRTATTLSLCHAQVKKATRLNREATLPSTHGKFYQMMKEAGPRLVGLLVSLFAASIRLRQVPGEWRKAIVAPIFKGGKKDRRDPTSYRPIALTSCVARVMEKILNGRIFDYLKKRSLIYEHQSGFQRNHSTVTVLLISSPMAHGYG